ncbi:MAG TPA: hypothetical protein VHY36_04895 [Steroidobacteraceae bacterium]|nr:hypothetical protein [Steroidobacteraceae bacterium]
MADRVREVDQWQLTSRVLQSVDRIGPGRPVKIVPVQYPMRERAWELENVSRCCVTASMTSVRST